MTTDFLDGLIDGTWGLEANATRLTDVEYMRGHHQGWLYWLHVHSIHPLSCVCPSCTRKGKENHAG